jgi:2,3-bisphosphoglycerate-independent phosphoglycerate mutase
MRTLIIADGANINRKSNDGKTPLELAQTEEIKIVLQETQKKRKISRK